MERARRCGARRTPRPARRAAGRARARGRRAPGAPAPAAARRGLVLRGEARVLLEDPALERAHRLAGLQAQLAQARGELAVGGERLDLPAARVQGQHQRAGELLAERLVLEQAAQRRGSPRAGGRARRARGRARPAPARGGPRGGGPPPGRTRAAAEVAVGRAAPERERALERGERLGGRERGRGADLLLEAVRVDLRRLDGEPVAGALADEQGGGRAALAARLQERAQVGDADGERARGDLARDVVPARVEQRVGRHGAARVDQQPREDRALLGARRRQRGRRAVDLDRAQDPELHASKRNGRVVRALTLRRDEPPHPSSRAGSRRDHDRPVSLRIAAVNAP